MQQPLLYEINTRCWLRELTDSRGSPVTLGNVPEDEFARWRALGFTHIWLMGVWQTGPRGRAEALNSPQLRGAFDAALPGWTEADMAGSPYAVAGYEVAESVGGTAGLKKFRKQLHAHGLQLVLDFVPNHVGLDHPWLSDRPELFVQSPQPNPDTFRHETPDGVTSLAHGRDPYFPGWTDTVQLDYRRADTRKLMVKTLRAVARLCDGVRCDMAMLVLNDIFAQTWAEFPGPMTPEKEFWAEAIAAVKARHRDFLFLGEVYWGLEARLQGLGCDYTYDKRLYDLLCERRGADVQRHLLDAPPDWVRASAHFLENHDEARIASRLNLPEHRAAALLVLGLPGLRLLHEGQLNGAVVHTPVQLSNRQRENATADIAQLYDELLGVIQKTAVGNGFGTLLRPRAAWAENCSVEHFVLVQWQAKPPEFDLVVLNLAEHPCQCYAPLSVEGLGARNWVLTDLLGAERHERFGSDLQSQGLYLDVPGHAAQLFHFQPLG